MVVRSRNRWRPDMRDIVGTEIARLGHVPSRLVWTVRDYLRSPLGLTTVHSRSFALDTRTFRLFQRDWKWLIGTASGTKSGTLGPDGGHVASTLSFGQWLRQRRKALDLTQEDLAQLVGCSAETIRKYEADKRRPSKQLG